MNAIDEPGKVSRPGRGLHADSSPSPVQSRWDCWTPVNQTGEASALDLATAAEQ